MEFFHWLFGRSVVYTEGAQSAGVSFAELVTT